MTRFGVQYATEGAAESGRRCFRRLRSSATSGSTRWPRRVPSTTVSSPLLGSSPSSRTLRSDEP